MKKNIYDESIQNSRIDLSVKTGKVKFGLPAKKKSRRWEVATIGILISIPYLFFILSVITVQFMVITDWTDLIVQYEADEIRINLIEILLPIIRFLMILFIPPFIIALYPVFIYRKLLKKVPKLQLFTARFLLYKKCYVARFENIKTRKVSIPLFENIILKYEATGDYAKYLKNIKITEHPFMQVMRSRKGVIVLPNEYLWKADIIFERVPKSGMIELYFM